MNPARRSLAMIWRWPAVLAVLTIGGLLAALLGQQGVWLPVSWLLLTIPLLVIIGSWHRRQTGRRA